MINSIQFIGTQRSGSNLLRLMLNQHSEISSHHPPHLLHTFYPLLSYYGDLNNVENRKVLVKDVCDWVRFNPISWDPIDLNEEYIVENSLDLLDMVVLIYQQKARMDQAKIWCCKSTFNISYIKELEEKVKPFYLYLYRDGRDVALSFKKAIVGPKHIYFIAKKWAEEQRESLALLSRLDKKRYAIIRYEELLNNPKNILENLCYRLNIEFSKDMLNYYNSEESKRTADSGEMWKNVIQPVIKNNFEKFKNELTPQDIKIFEGIAGEQLQQLGYSISNPFPVSFTQKQIANFKIINDEIVEKIKQDSSSKDVEKRKKQDELLIKIKQRFQIS